MIPAGLQDLPMDRAAAEHVASVATSLVAMLDAAMADRDRRLASARRGWTGGHRRTHDELDRDVRRAADRIRAQALALRATVWREVADVETANRRRAALREELRREKLAVDLRTVR